MSDKVGSVTADSDMVEHVGVAVEISVIYHSILEIQCTSGLKSAILNSGSQPTSYGNERRDQFFLTKFIDNMHEEMKLVRYVLLPLCC